MTDAFEDDPFCDWLFPDRLTRNRLIRTNIQLDLDFLFRRGTVATNAARQLVLGYRPPGSVLDPAELAAYRDAVLDAAESSGERLRLARLAVAGFGQATSGQSLGLYRRAGADLYGAPIRLPLDGPEIYPVIWKPVDTLPQYALHGP